MTHSKEHTKALEVGKLSWRQIQGLAPGGCCSRASLKMGIGTTDETSARTGTKVFVKEGSTGSSAPAPPPGVGAFNPGKQP